MKIPDYPKVKGGWFNYKWPVSPVAKEDRYVYTIASRINGKEYQAGINGRCGYHQELSGQEKRKIEMESFDYLRTFTV